MDPPRYPQSLLAIEWLAPLILVATWAIGIAQSVAKGLGGANIAIIFGLLGGLPTIGAALAAALLARRRPGSAVVALAVALLLHVVLWSGDGGSYRLAVILGCMCSGLTFLAATPVLVATALLARRRDEASGDTLLGIGGAWLIVVELGLLGYELATPRSVALGIASGLAVIGVALWRTRARRTFCMRAALGRIAGLRVRDPVASDPLSSLPILFGPELDATGILEEHAEAGTLYRAVDIAVPILRVPSAYAAIASCSR